MAQEEKKSEQGVAKVNTPKLTDLLVEEKLTNVNALTSVQWIKIGVLSLLFVVFNWWQFSRLNQQFLQNSNWTHGYIIPLFSLYLIYIRRNDILAAPRKVSYWGIPFIIFALFLYIIGVVPALIGNHWISQISMPIMIFGMVLFLAGKKIAWLLKVPIFYLLLMMPLPERIYAQIANPLQAYAAGATAKILSLFGVNVKLSASSMLITTQSGAEQVLQVVEACSGIKSMMAFIALGVVLAYIDERPLWQRICIIGSALPITIICNVLRIVITATMFYYDKPELGADFMHTATGMVLLVPAMVLLFCVGKILDMFYEEVEVEDPKNAEIQKDKKNSSD